MSFLTFATIIRLFLIIFYVVFVLKQFQHPKPPRLVSDKYSFDNKRFNRKYFWYRFLKRVFLAGAIIALCVPNTYTILALLPVIIVIPIRLSYKEDFPYFADGPLTSTTRALTWHGFKDHWKALQFI